jgi:hypothetical protein
VSGLGWNNIFDDLFEPENETMQKKIRGTTTRVVKPKSKAKPKITLSGQIREVARLNAMVEELNGNCARHLRDAEQAEKELRKVQENRVEYERVLTSLQTVIGFRLQTVYPDSTGRDYDNYGNPRPECERELEEEEQVLRKLLDMAQVNLNRSNCEMGMSPTKRNY